MAVPDALDDAALVARSLDGDREAFGLLVRRYLRLAHAVARGVVDDPAEADDVCQEAMLEALTRLESCREPARFGSWLLAIVRNRGHNRRRYLRLRRGEPLEGGAAVAGGHDPGRDVERAELRERLARSLSRLPEAQQQVVLMYDMEGRPHPEVAGALGITEESSRQLLHRARKALRRMLSSDRFFAEES